MNADDIADRCLVCLAIAVLCFAIAAALLQWWLT